MSENSISLQQMILFLKKEKGLTQTQIGEAVGLEQYEISRIANGRRAEYDKGKRIERFFNQQKTPSDN